MTSQMSAKEELLVVMMFLPIQETDTKKLTSVREHPSEPTNQTQLDNGDQATKLNTLKLVNKMFRM